MLVIRCSAWLAVGCRFGLLAVLCLAGLSAHGQSAEDYNTRGIQAYERGAYSEAIRSFERAYDQVPGNATVQANLVNAYRAHANGFARAGDFKSAIRVLRPVLRIVPSNPAPLVQLGSYYLNEDLVAEAIGHLEEAIEIQPGQLDAHELLGEAYYRDNDIPSARAQWGYVLEVDPSREALHERYEKAFREESVEYDFRRSSSRHFAISFPGEIPPRLRNQVLTILERAYIDIGRELGGVYPPPPIQVIAYGADQFAEATQLDGHIGAVYDGKIRVPLTDSSGRYLSEAELARRLQHEYVHVVVRNAVGTNVPWWFNEGLAETMSSQLGDRQYRLLAQIYQDGQNFQLAEIDAHQLRRLPPTALRMAYLQSHATVTYLWERYGGVRMRRYVDALANGMGFEEALRSVYRLTYAQLEESVAERIR